MIRQNANVSFSDRGSYYDLYWDGSSDYKGPNQSLIKSTTAIVNVFYDSMSFTIVDESPALSFDTLLANMGGNLGLLTGASILSFIELIELILSILIIVLREK